VAFAAGGGPAFGGARGPGERCRGVLAGVGGPLAELLGVAGEIGMQLGGRGPEGVGLVKEGFGAGGQIGRVLHAGLYLRLAQPKRPALPSAGPKSSNWPAKSTCA